jgi:hypothetical protein
VAEVATLLPTTSQTKIHQYQVGESATASAVAALTAWSEDRWEETIMLRYLLVAGLTALATPAFAGPGADFCLSLQDKSVACVNENEVMANATDGHVKASCPKAAAALAADYKSTSAVSPDPLRGELQKGQAAFLSSTKDIAPERGETEVEYLSHIEKLEHTLLASCVQMWKVDTAY